MISSFTLEGQAAALHVTTRRYGDMGPLSGPSPDLRIILIVEVCR
jgi:hypothetical protein